MEAAGLAVGGLSLLLELFDQSIKAYNFFQAGKNLEKASAHFSARLAIEEHRLLQWGRSSGILNKASTATEINLQAVGEVQILSDPALCKVVQQTLECIRDVLTDTGGLSKRYGLQVAHDGAGESTSDLTAQAGTQGRTLLSLKLF